MIPQNIRVLLCFFSPSQVKSMIQSLRHHLPGARGQWVPADPRWARHGADSIDSQLHLRLHLRETRGFSLKTGGMV